MILPGSRSAIAKNPSGALVRVDVTDGSIASLGVSNVLSYAASPTGAALVARTADRLYVLSREGEAKTSYASAFEPRLLAVSDEGATVALSTGEGEGEALYVVNQQGSKRVFNAPGIVSVAFLPGTNDAVFADKNGAVYLLKSDLQFGQIGSIPGVRALAGTADGRVIAVNGKTIAALRVDGSPASMVECACEATIARPLGNSRFVLTEADGPMWLLDASASDLRVAFVPEAVNE
jgi:hypothetical protein